jgi:hypothetical protein
MSTATKSLKGGSPSVIGLLSFAMIAAAVFWVVSAMPYLTARRASFGPFPELFWDRRYGLWIHILGGTLALFIGPAQLWLGETRQRLSLHRLLGCAYLIGVALLSLGAFYLSLTTSLGFTYASGLFSMALASAIATSMAYLAIRRRDFVRHREWMIRSYVVIFSFVIFRAEVAVLQPLGIGGPAPAGDLVRISFAAWSSWAIPLLLTQVLLELPKLRPSSRVA